MNFRIIVPKNWDPKCHSAFNEWADKILEHQKERYGIKN